MRTMLCWAAVAVAIAVPVDAGYHVRAETTFTGAAMGNNSFDAYVEGESAAIEFVTSDNPMMPAKSRLITNDGGATMYLVNEDGTCTIFDLDATMSAASNMMGAMGGMVKIEFSDYEMRKVSEESAGSILDYDVTKIVFEDSYVMRTAVMGMKQENRHQGRQEFWVTEDLPIDPMGTFLKNKVPELPIEGMKEMLDNEMKRLDGKVPLRSVIESTSTDKKGRESTTRQETNVTLVEEMKVPAGMESEEGAENPLRSMFGRKKKNKGDG